MQTSDHADGVRSIADLAVQAAGRRIICDSTGKSVAITLPSDEKIHSLEPYDPLRRRFRGSFETQSIEPFASYVEATRDAQRGDSYDKNALGSRGFIDVDSMSSTVFFNLGDHASPGHADHVARLKLRRTASYASLLAIVDRNLDQRQLHDFLEDNRDVLAPVYGNDTPAIGEPGKFVSALAAVRSIDIKTAREVGSAVTDFGGQKSALELVEAVSKHVLPNGFLWKGEPYEGLPSRTLSLRLGVITSGDKLALRLAIRQQEKVVEQIGHDFLSVLGAALGTGTPLTLGQFTS